MKIDLHLHSQYSWDSSVPIEDYIKRAERHGFGAIAITDHNSIISHRIISSLQVKTKVILIPGQEVTTADGHLLVYGWVDQLPANLSMKETVKLAKQQDGITIAAHPFDPFRGGSFSKIFETGIDGFELLNASAWFFFPNWLAKRAFKSHQELKMIGLGNSDSHRVEEFGTAYSQLEVSGKITIDSVLSQLPSAVPMGKRIGILRKLNRFIRRKFT